MSDQLKEEGLGLFRQGRREEAVAVFEKAAASYLAMGDDAGRGEMLNNIAVIYRMDNQPEAALEMFAEAEKVFRESGDRGRQGMVLGNLGDLYAFQGQPEEAARHYSDGAELLAEAGEPEKQAQILRALSLLNLRRRRIVEAMGLMEQSLRVRPRLNPFQRFFLLLLRFVLGMSGRR